MAYIGNTPAESFASFEKQVFTIVNSQTAYTLSHSVVNENDIRLVVNNVVQEPGSGKAYTASGTTLTLSAALVNGTDEMYCVYLGKAVQTVNPPSGSVGNSQTAPTIITGQTAETSIATDDTILIHDTSASALRKMTRANFVSGIGGANTPYFLLNQSSATTVATGTRTKVNIDNAVIDTASGLDTTNKRWVVPSGQGGTYFVCYAGRVETSDDFDEVNFTINKNGTVIFSKWGVSRSYDTFTGSFLVALSATDYLEMFVKQSSGSNKNISTTDQGIQTFFGGYKLIT